MSDPEDPPTGRRKEPRYPIALPIEEPPGAITVDLSSSGIAFETTQQFRRGMDVVIVIPIDRAGEEPIKLKCLGRIIRVDRTRRIQARKETLRVAAVIEWIDPPNGVRPDFFELVSEIEIGKTE